ncbi:hypothetical protein GCM10027286_11320 [Virgibacillus ainsalahensis]
MYVKNLSLNSCSKEDLYLHKDLWGVGTGDGLGLYWSQHIYCQIYILLKKATLFKGVAFWITITY